MTQGTLDRWGVYTREEGQTGLEDKWGNQIQEITRQESNADNHFNPNGDIPEFYKLAEDVNDSLIEMAKEGVIKYGQRGELAGKVRLDLGKTYPYYEKIKREEPVVAYTLKNVMDEWRGQHTGSSGWISTNRMFGLSDSDVVPLFKDRVKCAADMVKLEEEKKMARDESWQCGREMDDIATTVEKEIDVKNPEYYNERGYANQRYKDEFIRYAKNFIARNKNRNVAVGDKQIVLNGRIANVIDGMFSKGWIPKKPEAKMVYSKIKHDFFKDNYRKLIKPEYHDYVTPDIYSANKLTKVLLEKKLSQLPEYLEKTEECKVLDDRYKEKDAEYTNFRYSSDSPCKPEIDAMTRETRDFSNWMEKEILRNLWRE